MQDLLGKTIGQYQLIEFITQGDISVVYKGFQASMNRYVAVKTLSPPMTENSALVEKFRQAATLVAQLDHPNILPVFDYGQQDDLLYIVSPYVEGGTLQDRLSQIFNAQDALKIISPIAVALDYAHSQGVTHGNLKPSNILFDRRGKLLLTDFGFTPHAANANVAYRSPEQMSGAPYTKQADIYALGVLLYQLLAGELPPAGAPSNLRVKRPDLPVEVEKVILKATAQQPEYRFQTASELLKALSAATMSSSRSSAVAPPVSRPKPAPSVAPPDARQKKQKSGAPMFLIAGLAALLVCGLLIGGGLLLGFFGKNSAPDAPTPAPGMASLTATSELNVRSGPDTAYEKLGTMLKGQQAEVIGINPEHTWWVIKFPAAANGQGWVSGDYAVTENTANVPIVQPPAPPIPPSEATPTFTPRAPLAPNAVINGPKKAEAGQRVTFDANKSSADKDSSLVSFEWNFGDGATSSGAVVDHIYDASGAYTVKLVVTDDKGLQDQTDHKIKISGAPEPEQPPVAVITAPGQALVGEEIVFDASASYGKSALVNYNWNFGDGNTADAISVSKSYNAAGIYNVTLTVVDDRGLESDSVSVQIEITAEATTTSAEG